MRLIICNLYVCIIIFSIIIACNYVNRFMLVNRFKGFAQLCLHARPCGLQAVSYVWK